MPRVLTFGTFDLLHPGHVNFLARCAEHGSLTVAVNTDEFAARYKRPPVMTFEERLSMVSALRFVESVTTNHGDENCRPVIEAVKPDLLAHGDDWTGESLYRQMGLTQEWLDEQGVRMLYVPYTAGVSTSDIIDRVLDTVTMAVVA